MSCELLRVPWALNPAIEFDRYSVERAEAWGGTLGWLLLNTRDWNHLYVPGSEVGLHPGEEHTVLRCDGPGCLWAGKLRQTDSGCLEIPTISCELSLVDDEEFDPSLTPHRYAILNSAYRSISYAYSGANRSPTPGQTDHSFRRNPITDSGAIRSVIPVGSRSLLG